MIIRTTYILLIFLLSNSVGFSQSYANKKSSNNIFKSKSKTKKKAPLSTQEKINYARTIFNDSTSKAIEIIEDVLYESVNRKNKLDEASCYETLGLFNAKLNNHDIAIYNYEKALDIFQKKKKTGKLINNWKAISKSAQAIKRNTLIIKYETLIFDYYANRKSIEKSCQSKLTIGNAYLASNLSESEKAFNYVIQQSSSEDLKIKAQIGLGKVAQKRKQFKKAESLFQSANGTAEKNENDPLANESFNELSNLYQEQNIQTNNIQVQQQAYDYNYNRGNSSSAVQYSSQIANSYIEQNRTQEAMEVLENSTELVEQTNDFEIKKEFYKTLNTLYEKQGNKEKAEEIKTEYSAVLDSIKKEKEEKLLALQSKNELLSNAQNRVLILEKDRELNEKEILLLRKEQDIQLGVIQTQRMITWSLAIGFFIILILSFFIYKNNREKQISNQLLVLKSLRNQMNPHFIFNSLNSVNSFIAQQDERSANKYLSEFSKLMREVLEYSQEDFIPLAKEIEILELYLNLEHYRFKNEFEFSFNIDKSINLDDYQIPPMLLQPFIENAIWHGLRYKKGKGKLSVNFTQEKDHVAILIEDDGIGREKSKAFKTMNQKKMKSTGIKNIESRLEIIKNVFKKTLAISIEDANKTTKEGTKVLVKLH